MGRQGTVGRMPCCQRTQQIHTHAAHGHRSRAHHRAQFGHEVEVFEQGGNVGGVWHFDASTEADLLGRNGELCGRSARVPPPRPLLLTLLRGRGRARALLHVRGPPDQPPARGDSARPSLPLLVLRRARSRSAAAWLFRYPPSLSLLGGICAVSGVCAKNIT